MVNDGRSRPGVRLKEARLTSRSGEASVTVCPGLSFVLARDHGSLPVLADCADGRPDGTLPLRERFDHTWHGSGPGILLLSTAAHSRLFACAP